MSREKLHAKLEAKGFVRDGNGGFGRSDYKHKDGTRIIVTHGHKNAEGEHMLHTVKALPEGAEEIAHNAANQYRDIHNAASGEYKAAFKKVGAKLWGMDEAHLLKPEHAEAIARGHLQTRVRPMLPRPLTVLNSYKHVTWSQRKSLDKEVDAIHAKYSKQVKDVYSKVKF